jgi:hypothetical protein
MDTVKSIVDKTVDHMYIQIAGGEPMLHPHYRDVIEMFLALPDDRCRKVQVITNGSCEDNLRWSLGIRDVPGRPMFEVHMSDPFDGLHNPRMVNIDLYWQLKESRRIHMEGRGDVCEQGRAATKTGQRRILASGNRISKRKYCVCREIMVWPNGDVRQCSCEGAPILGNVNGAEIPYDTLVRSRYICGLAPIYANPSGELNQSSIRSGSEENLQEPLDKPQTTQYGISMLKET